MKNRTRTIFYDNRIRLFWLLLTVCGFSFLTYIYAINATARSIALRQEQGRQITAISERLNPLEFTYIALKNDITLELAYHYGFREAKNPLYVFRARPVALSFNASR